MEKIQRAATVTTAIEELVRKANRMLQAPRQTNSLGVYVDRWSAVVNLREARDRLDSAINVAEAAAKEWPTSFGCGEV